MSIHDHDDSGSQADHDYYLGEEAFISGFKAAIILLTGSDSWELYGRDAWEAWSRYEPSENVKG